MSSQNQVLDREMMEGRIFNTVRLLSKGMAAASTNLMLKMRNAYQLGFDPQMEAFIATNESAKIEAYIAAMTRRLEIALDRAIMSSDNTTKEEKLLEWEKAVKLERSYVTLHIDAVSKRLVRAEELGSVHLLSPNGAIWKLGEAKVHTADCLAMAGQAWTWPVLLAINPYNRHYGCKCHIEPLPPNYPLNQINNFIPVVVETSSMEASTYSLAKKTFRALSHGAKRAEYTASAALKFIERRGRQDAQLGGHFISFGGRPIFVSARKGQKGLKGSGRIAKKMTKPTKAASPKFIYKKVPPPITDSSDISYDEAIKIGPGHMFDEETLKATYEGEFILNDGSKVRTVVDRVEERDFEWEITGTIYDADKNDIGDFMRSIPVPPSEIATKKIQDDIYEFRVGSITWTATQKEIDPEFGEGKMWFAVADDGDYLDPLPKLTDVKEELKGSILTTVRHEHLSIVGAFQGQGFAAKFNRRAETFYRVNNVGEIHLLSNSDVGGYAWARNGYDFNDWENKGGPQLVRELYEQAMNSLSPGEPGTGVVRHFDSKYQISRYVSEGDAKRYHDLIRAGEVNTPYLVSILGRDGTHWSHNGHDIWFGKAILLGSVWEARKRLVPLQLSDFEAIEALSNEPVGENLSDFAIELILASQGRPGMDEYMVSRLLAEVQYMWTLEMDGKVPFSKDSAAAFSNPKIKDRTSVYNLHNLDMAASREDDDKFWKAADKAISDFERLLRASVPDDGE